MISVILPAHNEVESIRSAVCELDIELSGISKESEIIVVDDGSADGTLDALSDMRSKSELILVRQEIRKGKGNAIQVGISLARGTVIAYTDADMPIMPASVVAAIIDVASGACDVCVGNRRDPKSVRLGNARLMRTLGSWVYATYMRTLFRRLPQDPACCLKVFSQGIGITVAHNGSLDSYLFDVEALLIALASGASVKEAPVAWIDKRSALTPAQIAAAAFHVLKGARILKRKYGADLVALDDH